MPRPRTPEELAQDGYTDGGLFGGDNADTMRTLRRLLKPLGLTIRTYTCYREYGDRTWVKIVPVPPKEHR